MAKRRARERNGASDDAAQEATADTEGDETAVFLGSPSEDHARGSGLQQRRSAPRRSKFHAQATPHMFVSPQSARSGPLLRRQRIGALLPQHQARIEYCLRSCIAVFAACMYVLNDATVGLLPGTLLVSAVSILLTLPTLGQTIMAATNITKAALASLPVCLIIVNVVPAGCDWCIGAALLVTVFAAFYWGANPGFKKIMAAYIIVTCLV